jgi:hypothetical protein
MPQFSTWKLKAAQSVFCLQRSPHELTVWPVSASPIFSVSHSEQPAPAVFRL